MSDARPDARFDVFLSYASAEQALADRLVEALRARNVEVWIASEQIRAGDQWIERLQDGLTSSRIFAVIVTHASMKSRWVKKEYAIAIDVETSSSSNLRIVPLVFDGVQLPPALRTSQWVDFRTDFKTALVKLMTGIEAARQERRDDNTRESEPPRAGPATSPAASVEAEGAYLSRRVKNEEATQQQLTLLRNVSPVLGMSLGVLVVLSGALPVGREAAAVTGFLILITGFSGLGFTSTRIAASKNRAAWWDLLRHQLANCGQRRDAECLEYRARLWLEPKPDHSPLKRGNADGTR